jgi:integrase
VSRKKEGESSRNLNLQIVGLRNVFQFARREGVFKHDLPTKDLKQLPYKSQKRALLPLESIDALCAEATRVAADPAVELILRIQREYPGTGQKAGTTDWARAWAEHPEWKKQLHADTDNGLQALYSRANYLANNPEARKPQPVYAQGQMLCDWIRLMQYTGARRNAALHAKWEHVDWRNQQLHLFTKRNKEVVVDFNPKLEALLLDMHQRRVPLENGKLSAFLFPSPRPGPKGDCCLANFQKTYDTVRSKANLPDLNPHDLRHWFISMCVMEGFDFMSIAEWVRHAAVD